jgi:tetratricopeptide (TPR) repeat protein
VGWPSLSSSAPDTSGLSGREFYLHPHYRMPGPLDALSLKTQAGLDDFVTEAYAGEIAAVLARWSAGLLRSPQDVTAIDRVLLLNFSGASPQPVESSVARSGPAIEVRRNAFHADTTLDRDAFLREMRSAMSGFAKIFTAEFQVTGIDVAVLPAARPSLLPIHARIRYELVGAGKGSYSEQRVGYWQLTWERSASGELRVRNWQTTGETQSRSSGPGYVDIAGSALGGNASYPSQLLHGTDYWRTVLDGACGIDIYGHNGISVGDIEGNGFDDLYVCQPGGLPNRLYRNHGDGTFEDITEASGVGVIENTACALFVDVDNDGRQDLIVVRASGPMLFLNLGGGKFRQKADAFQFASPPQGTFTGAAVADYDLDGWLDIYFCVYVYYQGTGQYKYPSPYYDAQNGPPNFMMHNNRDGTFRDVTAESGLNQNNTRYSFCCGWADFNRDGWPDLYVVNDFGRKNLYRNNGNGTFTDIAPQAGVEDVGAGMGVCWFDYDNDGTEDLYVADMWTAAGERISAQEIFQKDAPAKTRALYRKHAMGNSLFRNSGTKFDDTTRTAGVGIGRWAWSSDAWDFDHDGLADLYIVNGMVSGPSREDLNSFFWRQVVAKSPDQAKASHDYELGWSAINELIRADGTWSGYERNIFYANNGDGTFSDVSGVIGLDSLEDGRAFALSDFDHDGRLEVFLKNRNGSQVRILKNVMEDLPPSIAFRLGGTKSNRDAIGAVVMLETELGRQTQWLQVRALQAGSGFLSQHSKDLFFGVGAGKGPLRASIRWPSGLVQELQDLPLNHRVWVEEGSEPSRMDAFVTSAAQSHSADAAPTDSAQQQPEPLPTTAETWLLAPIDAPEFSLSDFDEQVRTLSSLRGKPVLLNFWASGAERCKGDWVTFNLYHATWASQGLQLLAVNCDSVSDSDKVQALIRERRLSFPIVRVSEDVAAIYNILYRYLFDRHRDLALPTSFLVDTHGQIVKIYQGPINPKHVEQDVHNIPQTSAERIARALPFPGVTDTVDFGRNYLSYGSVLFQRGYMEQAESSFRIAFRDDPSSAEALYGIGSVYLDQQKAAEARDCFERALKLRASYPDTLANSWNNLGLLAGREGHTEDAVSDFQEALNLNPDHLIALNNLGGAYRQLKRWEDARTTYERALQVNSDDAEANYGLGMVFAHNDDTAHAFELLQKALKLRPANPEALNNLGILYLRTQRRNEAVTSFEECIRVAPTFDQSYLNLARVYVIEGAPDKARSVLLELLKQHPGHEQAKMLLKQLGQ